MQRLFATLYQLPVVQSRLGNAVLWSAGFFAGLCGLAGALWLVGHITGGN